MICASGASWASWAYWASWWGGRRGRQQSDWRAVWRAEREACRRAPCWRAVWRASWRADREACRRASCHPTAAFRTETCAFACSERGSAPCVSYMEFCILGFFFPHEHAQNSLYFFRYIFAGVREFASSRVREFAGGVREFAGGVRGFASSRVEFASSRVRGWSSRVRGSRVEFASSRVRGWSSRVRGWRSKFCRLPRNSADLHADARTR
jgi:hypothetical protein